MIYTCVCIYIIKHFVNNEVPYECSLFVSYVQNMVASEQSVQKRPELAVLKGDSGRYSGQKDHG